MGHVKTCKVCRNRFEPSRPMQVVCSPICATKYAWMEKSKAEIIAHREDRKTIRLKLEKLKTRSEWMRDAQKAFNSFVRARDDGKPCICCGKSLGGSGNGLGGHFDCGHYRSIGSAPHLRFDERNAHGQTKQCNRYGAGRAVDYRIGLIQRIGLAEVEKLEADNVPRKFTIEELKQIISTYKQKRKDIGNGLCR